MSLLRKLIEVEIDDWSGKSETIRGRVTQHKRASNVVMVNTRKGMMRADLDESPHRVLMEAPHLGMIVKKTGGDRDDFLIYSFSNRHGIGNKELPWLTNKGLTYSMFDFDEKYATGEWEIIMRRF